MSVNAACGKLKRASKDLLVRWDETRLLWYDENSRKFEDNHLRPLMAALRTAEIAMGNMDETLGRVRRDCS